MSDHDLQELHARCSPNACIDLRLLDQSAARYNDSAGLNYLESQQSYAVQQHALRQQTLEQMSTGSYSAFVAKMKAIGITF